jgi:hypothetical protein
MQDFLGGTGASRGVCYVPRTYIQTVRVQTQSGHKPRSGLLHHHMQDTNIKPSLSSPEELLGFVFYMRSAEDVVWYNFDEG